MTIRNPLLASHIEAFFVPQDLHNVADGLLLPPKVWDFLSAIEGHQTARELAERTGLPVKVCLALLRRLETMGLVARSRVPFPGLKERSESSPAQSTHETPAAEPAPAPARISVSLVKVSLGSKPPFVLGFEAAESTPQSASQAPLRSEESPASAEAEAKSPAADTTSPSPETPVPAAPASISMRLAARSPKKSSIQVSLRRPKADAENALPEQPSAARQPTVVSLPAKGLQLETIMRTLMQRTQGDRMQAQLLAYRVFLRVPTHLLEKAGIRSVFLIHDKHLLTDPELVEALAKAVRDVTGLHLDTGRLSSQAA